MVVPLFPYYTCPWVSYYYAEIVPHPLLRGYDWAFTYSEGSHAFIGSEAGSGLNQCHKAVGLQNATDHGLPQFHGSHRHNSIPWRVGKSHAIFDAARRAQRLAIYQACQCQSNHPWLEGS
jgi:hypothetical protein